MTGRLKNRRRIIRIVALVCLVGLIMILGLNRKSIKKEILKNPSLRKTVLRTDVWIQNAVYKIKVTIGLERKRKQWREATIVVEADKGIGTLNKFWGGVGMSSFNEGTLLPHNRAALELYGEENQKNQVFTHINAHGMLCDSPGPKGPDIGAHVYMENEQGKVQYNWQIIDKAFDLMIKNGLQPVVSLTFMPEKIAANVNRRNPWHKAIVSPPKDYAKWRNLIYALVTHLGQRYGTNEIAKWYFEVWNEPDLFRFFWVPNPDRKQYPGKSDFISYFKLYDYAANGALAANKNIKIGGPAIAGDIQSFINLWLPHLVAGKNYATGKTGTKISFLSRHLYGKIEGHILPAYQRFVDKAKANGKSIFPGLDILITETGPSTRIKNWLNTRYVAAWIIKEVDGFLNLAEEKGPEYLPKKIFFWTKPVPANFGNHFGLVTALGNKWHPSPDAIIKRPAYNALVALSKLGPERIAVSGVRFGDNIGCLATKGGSSLLQILLYHLDETDYENKKAAKFPVRLIIQDLPVQKFRTELYFINENYSNGFKAWEKMGRPENPSKEQLKSLQQNDDLQLVETRDENLPQNKFFKKTISLQNNSVALLIIKR